MPYIEQRWLGGTLTNWQTIRQRLAYLMELERRRETGDLERLPKKETLKLEQLIDKLNRRLGGLKKMTRLPNLVVIVDVRREAIAVKECNILSIPIMAMVDTNCDPDPIDFVIPANDDAIRAIKLIVEYLADAVNEGLQVRQALQVDEGEAEDEKYLGAATLAKLRAGAMEFEDELEEEEEEIEDEELDDDEERNNPCPQTGQMADSDRPRKDNRRGNHYSTDGQRTPRDDRGRRPGLQGGFGHA